jgi:hypothetical protein
MAEIHYYPYPDTNSDVFENQFDLIELDKFKYHRDREGFCLFAVKPENSKKEQTIYISALYNWSNTYNGCTKEWFIGWITGIPQHRINMPLVDDFMAGHKPDCWQRKWLGNKDLLGYGRLETSRKKILQEMGWTKGDEYGIAVHCDCGYNEFKEKIQKL